MSVYSLESMSGPGPSERSASSYYCQRRRKRSAKEPKPGSVPAFEAVVAPDNLIETFYTLKQRAGQAPGPDRLTYSSLGRSEVGGLMRDLSKPVMAGQYRPNGGRVVPIPQLSGGTRDLKLRGICDRVISAAVHEALTPLWETIFLPTSMGFRPGRGVHRMLAEIELVTAS